MKAKKVTKKKAKKNGFTLVELLAVIVILAVLMTVAGMAIGNTITNSNKNAFRSSAGQIVESVRMELQSEGREEEGFYYFNNSVVSQGVDSPLGGKIKYATAAPSGTEQISGGIFKLTTTPSAGLTCGNKTAQESFIAVSRVNQKYVYYICLVTEKVGEEFIGGYEEDLNSASASTKNGTLHGIDGAEKQLYASGTVKVGKDTTGGVEKRLTISYTGSAS